MQQVRIISARSAPRFICARHSYKLPFNIRDFRAKEFPLQVIFDDIRHFDRLHYKFYVFILKCAIRSKYERIRCIMRCQCNRSSNIIHHKSIFPTFLFHSLKFSFLIPSLLYFSFLLISFYVTRCFCSVHIVFFTI